MGIPEVAMTGLSQTSDDDDEVRERTISIVSARSAVVAELSTFGRADFGTESFHAYRGRMTDLEFARFLSVSDVAEILSVSVTTVRGLLDSGELASVRIGANGPIRIQADEVEAFIAHRLAAQQTLLRLRQAEYSNVADFTDGRLL